MLERKEEYVKCLQMLLREADKKRFGGVAHQTISRVSYFTGDNHSRFIQDSSRLPIAA